MQVGLRGLFLVVGLIGFVGCAPANKAEDGGAGSGGGADRPEGTEKPYNATPISYTGDLTTIAGTAEYTRWNDTTTDGLTTTSTRPIRFAEVHILDSADEVIQAGETDGSGNFSMQIPRIAGSYRVSVNSRSDNSNLSASVLDNPYDKKFYSLVHTFTLTGSETSTALTLTPAPYENTSTIEGGAFNILDNVLIANEFLRSEVTGFTVAPKIPIYWTKGLSPGVYYGAPDVGISFFVPSTGGGLIRGIYILGGIEDSICVDTDHFDNSVILHEYAHFLEDAYSQSASPGGSHSGHAIIDPRLAWSEGWANFFQAMALGRSYYRDTQGNASCSSSPSKFDFNMETQTGGQDFPMGQNEGIFREISIARTLYDKVTGPSQNTAYSLTNNTDGVAADLGFDRVWTAFEAIGANGFYFQNAGMFNQAFYNAYAAESGVTFPNAYSGNSTSVLDHENQVRDRTLYGQRLNPIAGSPGACSFSFQSGVPVPDDVSGGVVIDSDQLRNNDFYEYYYDGTTDRRTVYLYYSASGTPYDLDLYVYQRNYVYLDSSTLIGSDEKVFPEVASTPTVGTGVVDFTGKPPGIYMINVKVYYQASRATTTYYLQNATGEQLCP